MREADVHGPSRAEKALRFVAIAVTLVVLPPLLALLLLPLLLFAAPAALIGLPFMIPALLPGVLAARSEERRRVQREQSMRPALRVHALLDPMQLEPGKK